MPVQCPECARFLSNAFVSRLEKGPAPCPKCQTDLRAEQFSDADGDATVEPGTPVPDAPEHTPAAESVRPPDLPPTEVRDEAASTPDVLAGWDQPSNVVALSAGRHDHDPTAIGAAIGAGAAVGALLGGLLAERSLRGALLGGALGAGAGAAASQAMAKRHEVDLIE